MQRRNFLKKCLMAGCSLALGGYVAEDFFNRHRGQGLRVGFRSDGPAELWKWSRPADWQEGSGRLVRCLLCPHGCILGERDRGFCRTRVVLDGRLHTVAYGNPCAVHLDPMEKKPLYHFLPGTPILSIATAGCNLRCLNCQNWQISQRNPEEVENYDLLPGPLVERLVARDIQAIAYTYSEPLIFYEYVKDTSALARQQGIRNVLVTAGYIEERPLRELCKLVDAANVDLKGFNDEFYKSVTGSTMQPVLNALKIMQEEGVWLEVTRLVVPTLSDDMDDIRAMCDWIVENLGPQVPVHISRFHPQYKLKRLPPTPTSVLEEAYRIATAAGLHYVYVGNLPGNQHQDTICPECGEVVIKRQGYRIIFNRLGDEGRCKCGGRVAGVFDEERV